MRNLKGFNGLALRTLLGLFFLLGCARVSIDAKKPIQLDVTMRVDIYQHVARDADDIESMISSPSAKSSDPQKMSFFNLFVKEAFAQSPGDYPPDVMAAIERRKGRRGALLQLESQGVVGENASGLVVLRNPGGAPSSAGSLIEAENRDRKMIYAYVSKKNGASSEETARVFAKRIQADAPRGTPIQAADGHWTVK